MGAEDGSRRGRFGSREGGAAVVAAVVVVAGSGGVVCPHPRGGEGGGVNNHRQWRGRRRPTAPDGRQNLGMGVGDGVSAEGSGIGGAGRS